MSEQQTSKEIVERFLLDAFGERCADPYSPMCAKCVAWDHFDNWRPPDEPETALDDHSELLKKLPNVHPDLVAELEKLSKWALVRRVLIQADWLGSYSKCLDGLDLRVGVDGCWNPRDIRAAVEKLRAAEPPTASREQQLLTELAYWKARCGVMHGDETNAVTKSAGECGACDKPGEHCANVHGICSRHGGRAHETSPALCEHGYERGSCIIPSCEYKVKGR